MTSLINHRKLKKELSEEMIVGLYVVDKLSNKYCLKVPMNVCNNYGYIFIQLKMTVTMIIKKPLLCKSQ